MSMRPEGRPQSDLWDMRHAAQLVQRLVDGQSFDDFLPESLFRLGEERVVANIGESATRVSREFQSQHDEIPWVRIIRQRNVIIHGYATLDARRIWETATQEMQPLIDALDAILDFLEEQTSTPPN